MKYLIMLLMLLPAISESRAETMSDICIEGRPCILVMEDAGHLAFFVSDDATKDAIKSQFPTAGVAVDAQLAATLRASGEVKVENYTEADLDAYEAAMDEFTIAGASCLGTIGGCVTGQLGSAGAAMRYKFTDAIKIFAVGTAACIMIKPTCTDARRKYDKVLQAEKEHLEKQENNKKAAESNRGDRDRNNGSGESAGVLGAHNSERELESRSVEVSRIGETSHRGGGGSINVFIPRKPGTE